MADMMSTLRGFLGDNADEKISSAMSMLAQSGLLQQATKQNSPQPKAQKLDNLAEAINNDIEVENPPERYEEPEERTQAAPQHMQNNVGPMLTPEGLQLIGQVRNMVDQISNSDDPRSNLLRSLRPFMRTERQRSIDRAIRIMNIGRFSGLFGR